MPDPTPPKTKLDGIPVVPVAVAALAGLAAGLTIAAVLDARRARALEELPAPPSLKEHYDAMLAEMRARPCAECEERKWTRAGQTPEPVLVGTDTTVTEPPADDAG